MKQIELIEQHLREADGVADVLAVAWEIFDLVGTLAAAWAEQAADMYPAFMFARGAAVNGRNAIVFAPSRPEVIWPLRQQTWRPAGICCTLTALPVRTG